MTILVVGASGATGLLLVEQLLERGHKTKIIVRDPDKLPDVIKQHPNIFIIHEMLLNMSDKDMAFHVSGCQAVASCLGHNLNFKGIYGHPRKLVTEAAHRLCNAIRTSGPKKSVKYILMNTTGNRNRDVYEPISFGEKWVVSLMRALLPPHVDNEKAADYLRTKIGHHDPVIEWVAVRPDNLINEFNVTAYKVYSSPIRSAIFNPGRTSRINVAHFMAELIDNADLWNQWKGKMPVIYNKTSL